MVYVPKTMIGRAALQVWRQIGKEEPPLVDAERILEAIRAPDMALVNHIARETALGVTPEQVARCWDRMIGAILAEADNEATALEKFNSFWKRPT